MRGLNSPFSHSVDLTSFASGRERQSPLEEEVVALFDQFRGRLLRYLLALGLNLQDGEEVIQEVFLALFQHLRRGKSRRNLRGWIFRVAHNLGLKQVLRSRGSAECLAESLAVADPSPSAEEKMMTDERRERLRAVYRALPGQDRWCLHLRAEGLRYREIANVLGMSLGAVSISIGRSLARLSRVDG